MRQPRWFNSRRSGARPPRRPLRDAAPFTYWLLIANVLIFGVTLFHPAVDQLFLRWGLTPGELTGDFGLHALATVFTSMFLHGSLMHLVLNMAILWSLGRMVEEMVGGRRFVVLYLLGGIGAAALQIAFGPGSLVPMIGASGAISALIGASVMMIPSQKMWVVTPFTLFIPITLKMRTLGWAFVVLQVVGLFGADPFGGGVAYAAHLGGYIAGFYAADWLTMGRRRRSGPPPTEPVVRPGPPPSSGFRGFVVTDAQGRRFDFHEPK
ncbi:MAG: membrane associated rhomboid family serine protease [Myxococcota bacterium]|jgi:membrane associated rhomboid family serine protease